MIITKKANANLEFYIQLETNFRHSYSWIHLCCQVDFLQGNITCALKGTLNSAHCDATSMGLMTI